MRHEQKNSIKKMKEERAMEQCHLNKLNARLLYSFTLFIYRCLNNLKNKKNARYSETIVFSYQIDSAKNTKDMPSTSSVVWVYH